MKWSSVWSRERSQQLAVEEADAILFVVDGRAGLTAIDEEVFQILRRAKQCMELDNPAEMSHELHVLSNAEGYRDSSPLE